MEYLPCSRLLSARSMASRRLRKIDVLRQQLAASGGSLAETKRIAASLKYLEDRYMARPAAELMVERGDPQAQELRAGLDATPVLGREPHGDLLRAAFKKALATEGIPPDVEEMARAFYARRGRPKGNQKPQAPPNDDWIGKTETGGVTRLVRRLFGGG
jgi:hypothetical protein